MRLKNILRRRKHMEKIQTELNPCHRVKPLMNPDNKTIYEKGYIFSNRSSIFAKEGY